MNKLNFDVLIIGSGLAGLSSALKLADQKIIFKATVKDIRKANKEEMNHQHAHGDGGHHH